MPQVENSETGFDVAGRMETLIGLKNFHESVVASCIINHY